MARASNSTRGRRSSRRGAEGQREVAGYLKNWWQQLEPGCVFVSTPRSGGWKHAPRFNACGDVMTDAGRFPFVVEVKRRQAWSERNFERGMASPVWGWWRQCCRDAARQGGEPMLWFRKDGKRVWRVLLRRDFATLEMCRPILDPDFELEGLQGVEPAPVGFWAESLLSLAPESFL